MDATLVAAENGNSSFRYIWKYLWGKIFILKVKSSQELRKYCGGPAARFSSDCVVRCVL